MTISASRGSSRSIPLRLCARAPEMTIRSDRGITCGATPPYLPDPSLDAPRHTSPTILRTRTGVPVRLCLGLEEQAPKVRKPGPAWLCRARRRPQRRPRATYAIADAAPGTRPPSPRDPGAGARRSPEPRRARCPAATPAAIEVIIQVNASVAVPGGAISSTSDVQPLPAGARASPLMTISGTASTIEVMNRSGTKPSASSRQMRG